MKTNPQDGVLMSYVMVISGAEKIHSCVKVFKEKTFSVTVLGRQVDSSIIVEETKISSPDILSKILDLLDTTKLCKGSTGFSDLFSKTRVFESSGNLVAYAESGYGTESTIRHKDCHLFLQDAAASGMCHFCSLFKSNLFPSKKKK